MGVISDHCTCAKNNQIIGEIEQFKQLTYDIDFSTIIKNFFNEKNDEIGEKLNNLYVVGSSENEVDQLAQEYLINLIILDFCYKKLHDNQYIENTLKIYFNLFLYSLHTFKFVTQHSNDIRLNFILIWLDKIVSLYESVSNHWNKSLIEQNFQYKSEDLKKQLENIENNKIDSQCKLAIKIMKQISKYSESLDLQPFYLIQKEIKPIRERYFI